MNPITNTAPMTDVAQARAALLELHRRLLQAQRIEVEREHGRMSAGQVLQAATEDLRFRWLAPLSELIAGLDGARADADDDAVQSALAAARGLLAPPDPSSWFGARYLQTLQERPDVVFAHRDVTAALAD
jgi:hypothetical protein